MKQAFILFLLVLHLPFSYAKIEWKNIKLNLDINANIRNSVNKKFATGFPFSPELLPPGQTNAFLETVEAGSHTEISSIELSGQWKPKANITAQFKIITLDLYDRNPTSSDRKTDIDFLWIRYGKKNKYWQLPQTTSTYMQFGKFAHFERQNNRHLESYGLISTVFNRFEDSGFEAGLQMPQGIYARFSWTTGNPLFFRDPNALAGDNGNPGRNPESLDPNPNKQSGFPIFYDAEIESLNLVDDPELSLGLGYKLDIPEKSLFINLLAWYNQRQLAANRSIAGTFYGADLDILSLDELFPEVTLNITNNDKKEYGFNLWIDYQQLALFGQFTHQQLAGMKRTGWEIELAYAFDNIPWFDKLTPVLRYSELNPDFSGSKQFPAPSIFWDWRKIDYGVRIKINKMFRLTIEYADNEFVRKQKTESQNEFLFSLRMHYNLLR